MLIPFMFLLLTSIILVNYMYDRCVILDINTVVSFAPTEINYNSLGLNVMNFERSNDNRSMCYILYHKSTPSLSPSVQ